MFRLITFDSFDKHSGHFNRLVHSHITVRGLHEVIRSATDVQTTQLAIFSDRSLDSSNILSLEMTLEDCGCKGGPEESPEELILYYDYNIDFTECPILLCDYYFGKKHDQNSKQAKSVRFANNQKSVHN